LELQQADYHWKQMEWIGWFNEWKAGQVVIASIGGGDGPRYGNTKFDYRRNCVWDFKIHLTGSRPWTILNDQEAIDSCIREHGAVRQIPRHESLTMALRYAHLTKPPLYRAQEGRSICRRWPSRGASGG